MGSMDKVKLPNHVTYSIYEINILRKVIQREILLRYFSVQGVSKRALKL
jgi:hypothetical protein